MQQPEVVITYDYESMKSGPERVNVEEDLLQLLYPTLTSMSCIVYYTVLYYYCTGYCCMLCGS